MNHLCSLVEKYRKKDGIIDAFGLILYTDEHANIIKVLRDDDFWRSFHEISGPEWGIFSIKPKKGYFGYPELGQGQIGFMIPIWREPCENTMLLNEFNLESTKDLPLFVIFTHLGNEILQVQIKIDDSSIDKTYASIKEMIKVVSSAIKNIILENYKNPEGVFSALQLAINNYKEMKRIKKGISFHLWMKRLLT